MLINYVGSILCCQKSSRDMIFINFLYEYIRDGESYYGGKDINFVMRKKCIKLRKCVIWVYNLMIL